MADIVAQRYQAITDRDNQLPANHVPTEPGSAYNTYQRLTENDEAAIVDGWTWETLLPVPQETEEIWHGISATYPHMGDTTKLPPSTT